MGSFAKARYEFKFLKASNAFAKDRFANQPFVAAVLARAIQGCRRRYKSGRGLRACRPRFALSWPSRILSGRGAKSHSGFGGVTLITSQPFHWRNYRLDRKSCLDDLPCAPSFDTQAGIMV
jgi:hypothetical protein